MGNLKLGWDGHNTPPLPKICLTEAQKLKDLLDTLPVNYYLFPGPGGFVEFEFEDSLNLSIWVYGVERGALYAEADKNDWGYEFFSFEELSNALPDLLIKEV